MPISPFPATPDQTKLQAQPGTYVPVKFSEDGLISRRDASFAKDFLLCWHQEDRNNLTQPRKERERRDPT